MIIIYIDIVLIVILMALTLGTCAYCVYKVHGMQRRGELALLLKPTKVVFTHREHYDSYGELRSVVAYKNPLTGEYCVHKSRSPPTTYVNEAARAQAALTVQESPDSGLSDAYEPCPPRLPSASGDTGALAVHSEDQQLTRAPALAWDDNSVNRPRNWNYNEYQI